MQLVHMDVCLPGNTARQVVGPLASGLNAIIGPRGSGKTRLLRWLRQVTAEDYGNQYVPAKRSQVNLAGEVELRNHGTALRLTRDDYGRVRSNRPQSDHHDSIFASARDLTVRQRQAFAMLADVSDTSTDACATLDEVARRLGFEAQADLPQVSQRDLLVGRERDLVARLDSLQRITVTREELIARRRDIEHKLDSLRAKLAHHNYDPRLDRNRLLDRYATIEADLNGAEAELRQVDLEIAKAKAELKQCEIGQQSVQIEPSYREQLQQLEDRLSRWRKTLRDLKAHRESLENQETEAKLDQQVGTQLSGSLTADPRASMRSLEAQLHHARKQLDEMIGQYWPQNTGRPGIELGHTTRAVDPRTLGGYQVQRDPYGRTHISYDSAATGYDASTLPEMLRSMQRDLHDICHQLSRQEAANSASALKQQADQLRRCEKELLNSVEKLIEERGALLRRIADRYNLTSDQLSLTFGDWCQCNDHPHLYDWLVQEEAPQKLTREVDTQARGRLEESLARLESQRRGAALRAEECRRQLREANRARVSTKASTTPDGRQAEEADLLRELDQLQLQLADLENRDRMVADLDEVRRQLSKSTVVAPSTSEYRQAVDRNIVGLCGSLYQAGATARGEYLTSRQYDSVNGVVTEQPVYRNNFEVPAAVVRTAQRLAIGQLLALRGDAVPVVLDQTLDGLDGKLQQAAMSHLALASQRTQVVVLTDDSHIADLVRQYRGNVVGLQQVKAPQNLDVNRQLAAYANDEEADKWYQPMFDPIPRSNASEFYLNITDAVQQHPSIHPSLAARCRQLGVVAIQDLIDVDPQWLAENLDADGVTANRVAGWQSTADILCSVRNLRPFDAKIIVGSGISSASQLKSLHPSDLADRIEQFITTELGSRVLRSGNQFEQARISDWINSARRDSANSQQFEYGYGAGGNDQRRGSRGRSTYPTRLDARQQTFREQTARRESMHNQNGRNYPTREERRTRHDDRQDRDYSIVAEANKNGSSLRTTQRSSTGHSQRGNTNTGSSAYKFYLEASSPVVDAPSIGDRMAERLQACGIHTVQQLLNANPEGLANKLANRRFDGEMIKVWQDQARLVCRIPNLRGHDAQMLVACGIVSPESLLGMSAEAVLHKVLGFAKSTEGQRVLRGSKEPDLAEVKDWLGWAAQSRSLNAA